MWHEIAIIDNFACCFGIPVAACDTAVCRGNNQCHARPQGVAADDAAVIAIPKEYHPANQPFLLRFFVPLILPHCGIREFYCGLFL